MKNTTNSRFISRVLFLIAATLINGCASTSSEPTSHIQYAPQPKYDVLKQAQPNFDTLNQERYTQNTENTFLPVLSNPLSTFSIDVDTASYSNIRRFIQSGQLPPRDAIRIEEMVNYFDYDYPEPESTHPFSISGEVATCPWNTANQLVQIGLKGKTINNRHMPPANLVFLIDVSGSMHARLPLVKSGLKLLVRQMRPQDRISIVVYAGAAGLVLPPTPGNEQDKILSAINWLRSGGSTAGGAGIKLAYATALENFNPDHNNRIVLATDGDFNVGPSSESELLALIEQKRQLGIFLTVLGFGRGNINDTAMELLADKGNGNYAYIDTLLEAKKVLVNEMGGTLFTIAKDVKIQLQFNPAIVESYRLIGYENRLLEHEDFSDDTKDAGDIGAGHSVTALYEIVPAKNKPVDNSLTYIETRIKPDAVGSDEILSVNLRYKLPADDNSQLIAHSLKKSSTKMEMASENLRFASAVAEFGLLLQNSTFKAHASYAGVAQRAQSARDGDSYGYRSEFIQLVKTVDAMK